MSEDRKPPEYNCGGCFFWVKGEKAAGPKLLGEPPRGVCFGTPPSAAHVLNARGEPVGQRNARPLTLASERACGTWMPWNVEFDPNADFPSRTPAKPS